MKECVQCKKVKPLEDYRQYPSRGKGIRNGRQRSYTTVCRSCESLNSTALGAEAKGWKSEQMKEDCIKYYKSVPGKLPRVALRLLGIEDITSKGQPPRANAFFKALAEEEVVNNLVGVDEAIVVATKIRSREYGCADEAYDALKLYKEIYEHTGVWDELSMIVEEWFEEE